MDEAFWRQRWQERQIGFHEGKPNELLQKHFPAGENKRVLVPLCGKAVDLDWIAARGHDVTGIDVVEQAIREYFSDRAITPEIEGNVYRYGRVRLVCADFFTAPLGTFDLVYDRAALVALDPPMRAAYAKKCQELAPAILLVAFSYDQTKAPGPPWSVDEAAVRALYGNAELLERRSLPTSERFKSAGITSLDEAAYLIRR